MPSQDHSQATAATQPGDWRTRLRQGLVIPACPLMLHEDGRWSPRYQRGVMRYYLHAGAGGIAVGVHSTQFAIREPRHGLLEPVLRLVADEVDRYESENGGPPIVRIAGICGRQEQALGEARLATRLGYHAGLLSLTAVGGDGEAAMLEHARAIGDQIPLIGFYLQPAVGGRVLSFDFWRRFCEIPAVVAIKIAPFNRYQTLDVVRAVIASGRGDIALYTGNDDNIIADLLTPFDLDGQRRWIVGGLLGQWGVWTRRAVELLEQLQAARGDREAVGDRETAGKHDAATEQPSPGDSVTIALDWLAKNAQLTDANAAVFDAANGFAGCIPGILEALRRQGLAPSRRCLDPAEVLSPGQAAELDRVSRAYPWLLDDEFVARHLVSWLDSPDEPVA